MGVVRVGEAENVILLWFLFFFNGCNDSFRFVLGWITVDKRLVEILEFDVIGDCFWVIRKGN